MAEDGDPRCLVCDGPVQLEGCHAWFCPNCKKTYRDDDEEA